MQGKKGIIFGVSNKFGIANAIAEAIHKEGGEIAFTYANEAMEKRVKPIADEMNSKMCSECDVTKEEDVKRVFEEYAKKYDTLDFVIHAAAFANKDDLAGEFYTTSKEGWIWQCMSVHILC
jgi:enoyl-[acyl-carrier protein] reductase I